MFKLRYWILLLASQSVFALTTLTVSLNSDNNPGGLGDVGDLRYALNTMNQQLSTIPDDYNIVFATPMLIQLNGMLPIINNSANPVNITIGNPGSLQTVTIDGNSGAYGGFFIPNGTVTIQNMRFQNMTAKGGDGGNGMAAGGGGMGAGGAIYTPTTFLNGSNPSVILQNVSISNTSAVGGAGGSYIGSLTGNEGGGGGGGFSGNGGSIIATGITGGAGGGGFGGNGGDVTLSTADLLGGGGGGGGGIGSRATLGVLTNLGNGGADANNGQNGNGYGLTYTAGAGGGGNTGGSNAGGGGGGAAIGAGLPGGGGGGSAGSNGLQPQGSIPPLKKPAPKRKLAATPSGGTGGDGAGGGGGGVVTTSASNSVDGQSGGGGYGGGGGGGAGTGAYDVDYSVQGAAGGVGGGGGGGGVNQSGLTPATGGNSIGGGGGGGGPSNGLSASGGVDVGNLGGGAGGSGANNYGSGFGGGGGGGGSGLGGAIFVDSNLNFTIAALSGGVPTSFDTTSTTAIAGTHGAGGPGGTDGLDGSALGNSIFLRSGASLTFLASDASDLLTLGSQVAFNDDTTFGGAGSSVFVKGNGTVIYNGTTDYLGNITVNNANFKVNGQINSATINVCRNVSYSAQRGTLSGTGVMTGNVFANSGAISPEAGGTLTVGSLTLNNAASGSLGSLVHININAGGTSKVVVNGAAALAGKLEISLDPAATPGSYIVLTAAGGITGTFSAVTFTGTTPNYTISYLPAGAPTYVQFNFTGYPSSVDIPATVNGSAILNPAVVCCGRPIMLGPLPVPGSGTTTYSITNHTGSVLCQIGQTKTQTYLKMHGNNGSCTIVGTKNGVVSNPLTVIAS